MTDSKMTPERVVERLRRLAKAKLASADEQRISGFYRDAGKARQAAREYEAMAETVRTLEVERDRLRRVVNAAWGAFTDADEVGTPLWEALEKEGFVVCREATKADAAEAFAYERGIYPGGRIIELTPAGRAALHPEPLGEGGGL